MVLVVDEYGGISGLATMEDLIEEIVGEIHDDESGEEKIIEENPGSYLVPGSLDLSSLDAALGHPVCRRHGMHDSFRGGRRTLRQIAFRRREDRTRGGLRRSSRGGPAQGAPTAHDGSHCAPDMSERNPCVRALLPSSAVRIRANPPS